MAFGDSGTLNSNVLAGMFSQVITKQGLQISRMNNGFLYWLLGKPMDGVSSKGAPRFEGLDQDVEGQTIEWTLETKPRVYTAVTDGTNEYGAQTYSYDANVIAGAKADVAHYPVAESVPISELKKMRGQAAKVKNWIQQLFNYWVHNFEVTLGKAINGMTSGAHVETNQGQAALGSWTWPVSDSTDAAWAASTKTYGGIDRSVAANSDFASYSFAPVSGTGKLAMEDYTSAQTRTFLHGGRNMFALIGELVWNITKKLITALAGYGAVTVRDNSVDYGGQFFTYDGIDYVLDAYAAPGIAGLLCPDSWAFKLSKDSFEEMELVRHQNSKAIKILQYDFWAALICKSPIQNAKIRAITS